ncbi:pro-sigmaK processing inhibitor BofA family protein [Halobacterium rubrum]|uniref:pro-sigmaK processing inhibitor BofA family protein n=1 Tax=Halobacterium TaxID=2239 RepID=UPI001F3A414C|nr:MULTISPECIES: pro-sigmaK processing inhibitor BofA family protein [Halobacterium]MDH5019048.1 pro-sigmaK processing inhibitor BofA family protein [Halobacterium rubrum]
MATTLELALVALVLAALFGAYRVIRAVKPFVVNAVVGLVVILLAQALGAEVAVTPLALLVVAIAGFPGAVLVILLAYVGVAFAPGLAALPLVVGVL